MEDQPLTFAGREGDSYGNGRGFYFISRRPLGMIGVYVTYCLFAFVVLLMSACSMFTYFLNQDDCVGHINKSFSV